MKWDGNHIIILMLIMTVICIQLICLHWLEVFIGGLVMLIWNVDFINTMITLNMAFWMVDYWFMVIVNGLIGLLKTRKLNRYYLLLEMGISWRRFINNILMKFQVRMFFFRGLVQNRLHLNAILGNILTKR